MNNLGKNKRRQLTCFDDVHNVTLSVDSNEEVDFINWLSEAKSLSVINDFQYQPASFVLFDNTKYTSVDGKTRTLFQDHIYTADFVVSFNPNTYLDLTKEFKFDQAILSASECSAFIDVKGTFNRTSRSFNTDRKWVWDKFKKYIYELVPTKFFKLFGCPDKCRLTAKTKKPRSCYLGFSSLRDIFKK